MSHYNDGSVVLTFDRISALTCVFSRNAQRYIKRRQALKTIL